MGNNHEKFRQFRSGNQNCNETIDSCVAIWKSFLVVVSKMAPYLLMDKGIVIEEEREDYDAEKLQILLSVFFVSMDE